MGKFKLDNVRFGLIRDSSGADQDNIYIYAGDKKITIDKMDPQGSGCYLENIPDDIINPEDYDISDLDYVSDKILDEVPKGSFIELIPLTPVKNIIMDFCENGCPVGEENCSGACPLKPLKTRCEKNMSICQKGCQEI